jgi:hypothetical protein
MRKLSISTLIVERVPALRPATPSTPRLSRSRLPWTSTSMMCSMHSESRWDGSDGFAVFCGSQRRRTEWEMVRRSWRHLEATLAPVDAAVFNFNLRCPIQLVRVLKTAVAGSREDLAAEYLSLVPADHDRVGDMRIFVVYKLDVYELVLKQQSGRVEIQDSHRDAPLPASRE